MRKQTYKTRARNSVTVNWMSRVIKGKFEPVIETRLLIKQYPTDRLGKEIK